MFNNFFPLFYEFLGVDIYQLIAVLLILVVILSILKGGKN